MGVRRASDLTLVRRTPSNFNPTSELFAAYAWAFGRVGGVRNFSRRRCPCEGRRGPIPRRLTSEIGGVNESLPPVEGRPLNRSGHMLSPLKDPRKTTRRKQAISRPPGLSLHGRASGSVRA